MQPLDGCSWVACASTAAASPVNRTIALKVLQVLFNPAMLTSRSLPDLFAADGNLCLQGLKFHVEQLVYLKVRPTCILCSGVAAAMRQQCEHSTYLRSLALPNFPQPPLILPALPAQKRNGRPSNAAVPQRKRRRKV